MEVSETEIKGGKLAPKDYQKAEINSSHWTKQNKY